MRGQVKQSCGQRRWVLVFLGVKILVKSLLSLTFVRPLLAAAVVAVILEQKFIAAFLWNCFSESHPWNNKGLFINQLSLIRLISSSFCPLFFSPFFLCLFSSVHTLPQAFACSLIFSIFIKQKYICNLWENVFLLIPFFKVKYRPFLKWWGRFVLD